MHSLIPSASSDSLGIRYYPAPPGLEYWVQCLWVLNNVSRVSPCHVETRPEILYPDAGSAIIFNLSSSQPEYFISATTQRYSLELSDTRRLLGVHFKAGGLSALLGVPAQALVADPFARDFDISSSLANELSDLTDQLLNSLEHAWLELVVKWLSGTRDRNSGHVEVSKQVVYLAERVYHSQLSIENLVQDIGVTRRTLERRLLNHVGVSPKRLNQFGRLHSARELLCRPDIPLADVALSCGFYDQAHLHRSFVTETQQTPMAYRKRKTQQRMSQKYNS